MSCFDDNSGLFETLFGAEDAIISDALNHASIIEEGIYVIGFSYPVVPKGQARIRLSRLLMKADWASPSRYSR